MLAITHLPSPSFNECQLTFLKRQPIDLPRARQQHQNYCKALGEEGLEVITLSINSHLPDCAFVEDAALVLDEIAIICSPGTPARQAEVGGIEEVLSKYRRMGRISLPATLEGGDVLRIGRKLYVGHSKRTNASGVKAVRQLVAEFGYQVVPVAVHGALHLKTACTALSSDTLLLNPAWIDPTTFEGYKIIEIAEGEPFAANTLALPSRVLMNAAYPITIGRVELEGINVLPIDISEFSKAEAGLTCMSLVFDDK